MWRWISDLVKSLPLNVVLQDKNDKLTADNATLSGQRDDLKEQLRQERLMVRKLNERVQQLEARVRQLETPDQLDENEVKVLQLLSERWAATYEMAELLSMNQTRLEHHVHRLMMGNYLQSADYMGVAKYGLGPRGREYLVKNDLLPEDGPPKPPSRRA